MSETTQTSAWYQAMTKATRKREHAQRMVAKWAAVAAETEDQIQKLANELSGEDLAEAQEHRE